MVLVWKPITDLPPEWRALTERELDPLLRFWNDQRSDLEVTGALNEFSKRLNREWSIETGQIEGVYNLDRGITETLIERGINAALIPYTPGQKQPELIAAILQDHNDVLEGLFQFVRGERPISTSYINELHSALLKHQDTTVVMDQFGQLFDSKLTKGQYKTRPNNPRRPDGTLHQYSPPEQVTSEMERLIALHKEHEVKHVPVEVEAAWLHHRFAQIHPYQDGNGRVARALASLIFIKAGWFPVVVTRDDRTRYIDALEVADEGDLRSLVAFFVDVQKRALFKATQAAADVQQAQTVDEAIAAVKRVLTGPGKSLDPSIWLAAKDRADRLMGVATRRLESLAASLKNEIGKNRPEFKFHTQSGGMTFLPSLEKLGYTPNKIDYERKEWLAIAAQHTSIIAVQAHAIGSKFRGLIGIGIVFNGTSGVTELASKEAFQVNYAESYENMERRFIPWLEQGLVDALTFWRKSL
jgi:Fic family protein